MMELTQSFKEEIKILYSMPLLIQGFAIVIVDHHMTKQMNAKIKMT